jgi:hypothetical protein
LNRNLDYIYVYVALVSTNTITVTAWRWPPRLSSRNSPIEKGESRDESQDKWRFKSEISLIAINSS